MLLSDFYAFSRHNCRICTARPWLEMVNFRLSIKHLHRMRKIIVVEFMSLDGVIQGPGGPEEDPSGDFKYGGWVAPYSDEELDKVMLEQMEHTDLLLGRKTYDIWAAYWPEHESVWPGINDVSKYVLSTTLAKANWKTTSVLRSVEEIRKLKNSSGPDLKVWGSSKLVHLLLSYDLVDELWLKIYPLLLGKGKKLFDEGLVPAAFEVAKSMVTPSGVIVASYKRAGEVETGKVSD